MIVAVNVSVAFSNDLSSLVKLSPIAFSWLLGASIVALMQEAYSSFLSQLYIELKSFWKAILIYRTKIK